MLVLGIETSSARGSLALMQGEDLLAEAVFPEGLVHGREITVHLEAMMRSSGFAARDLSAIVVGVGPGSYTGIRVGVTAAKSLAFALAIPIVPVSSLEATAANALEGTSFLDRAGERIAVAIDGKQRNVYFARFATGRPPGFEGLRLEREIEDRVIDLPPSPRAGRSPATLAAEEVSPELRAELRELIPPATRIAGDAAAALVDLAAGPDRPRESFIRGPASWDRPRASRLLAARARAIAASPPRFDREAVHQLVPVYLRPSEAERKLGSAR